MTALEFRMPDVGEGIADAEIIRWFLEVGEQVDEDQPICAVETDKSVVEIPAPAAGTITERHGEVGEMVAVGSVLVIIAVDETSAPYEAVSGPGPASSAAPTADSPTVPGPRSGPRPKASPRVRRMAARTGVGLNAISGTGPHGRILEADLDRAGEGPSAQTAVGGGSSPVENRLGLDSQALAISAPAGLLRSVTRTDGQRGDQVIPLRGLRRSIARSMTTALTIPHVTEFREVDATNLLAAHRTLRASLSDRGVRLSLFPLLLEAVIRALQLQPSMNATFDADAETVTQHGGVHLGMATATDDGLIVPVIHHAEQLDLVRLAMEVERLAEGARSRSAAPEELTGGTFTVTNFGSFGTWLGNPIIRPPEVGIAGFGRISEKVMAIDGQPLVRPVLPIVVATDHRVHDGSHLADFVTSIAAAVTDPVLLLA